MNATSTERHASPSPFQGDSIVSVQISPPKIPAGHDCDHRDAGDRHQRHVDH